MVERERKSRRRRRWRKGGGGIELHGGDGGLVIPTFSRENVRERKNFLGEGERRKKQKRNYWWESWSILSVCVSFALRYKNLSEFNK